MNRVVYGQKGRATTPRLHDCIIVAVWFGAYNITSDYSDVYLLDLVIQYVTACVSSLCARYSTNSPSV